MLKILSRLTMSATLLVASSAYSASATPIAFGIDCMIHDNQGKMLSDLGMIGAGMGSYLDSGTYTYGDLRIEASLSGPFPEAPEVASPQLKLTVLDRAGNILASSVSAANPDLNAALFIPGEKLYLHCDKMDM